MNYCVQIGLVTRLTKLKTIDSHKYYMTIVLQDEANAQGKGVPINLIGKTALNASKKLRKGDILLVTGKIINTRDGLLVRGERIKVLEHLEDGKYLSQKRLEETFDKSMFQLGRS